MADNIHESGQGYGLSNEDELRLHVLLSQNPDVIRIDESKMTLSARAGTNEMNMQLHPNCRDENYLKAVRQVLSLHALGSPSGYPTFLNRWTRMGQMKDKSLKKLLLLGENEAVSAVIHAPGLNEELALLAWWAHPNADNARQMLSKQSVANTSFGQELANFLIEYLPFETRSQDIAESVHLVLKHKLVNNETVNNLWQRGERKSAYYIGFLLGTPDAIPLDTATHSRYAELAPLLTDMNDDPCIPQLKRLLSTEGQAFLATVFKVIQHAPDQDAMIQIFAALKSYFQCIHENTVQRKGIDEVKNAAGQYLQTLPSDYKDKLYNLDPSLQPMLEAMLCLSLVEEGLLDKFFGQTDAVGSVMRRKLRPLTNPICDWLAVLCSDLSSKTKGASDSDYPYRRSRGQRPSRLR